MNIVKNVNKDKTEHVCQLPVKLIDIFIKASSNKNEIVFDPFIGSGTVAVACKQLNRQFIGFELSKEYCDIANKRLARTYVSHSLFEV